MAKGKRLNDDKYFYFRSVMSLGWPNTNNDVYDKEAVKEAVKKAKKEHKFDLYYDTRKVGSLVDYSLDKDRVTIVYKMPRTQENKGLIDLITSKDIHTVSIENILKEE